MNFTVPVFVLLLGVLYTDLFWCGIVTVMIVEISLIAQPVEVNAFVKYR